MRRTISTFSCDIASAVSRSEHLGPICRTALSLSRTGGGRITALLLFAQSRSGARRGHRRPASARLPHFPLVWALTVGSRILPPRDSPNRIRRHMYAAIRKYPVSDVDALVKKVEDEFVEQVKVVEGFVGYYVIDGGDGTATSVTVGETTEAVEESTRRAADWVKESASDVVDGAPDVTAGEVRVRAER